jgi:uncharacterized RDD family membrane protein YckC
MPARRSGADRKQAGGFDMTQPAGWPQPPAGTPGGQWAQPTQVGPAPGMAFGGFWIRFVAFVIDFILIGILEVIAVSISASLLTVVYLVALLYFPLCWGLLGHTIGMIPFGLNIVRNADGGKLTWGNVIMRLIGWFVSALVIYIGFIWAAFDSRKRGWHDMIGGTVVVRRV